MKMEDRKLGGRARYAHPSPFTTHERRLREPQRCLPGRSCVKGRRTVKAEGRNELSRVQRLNAARIPSSFPKSLANRKNGMDKLWK